LQPCNVDGHADDVHAEADLHLTKQLRIRPKPG
jgi:hypothetical protein